MKQCSWFELIRRAYEATPRQSGGFSKSRRLLKSRPTKSRLGFSKAGKAI
jgi:hypothetical protein